MSINYPRIQLLTVGDLLNGTSRLEYPHVTRATFKKAPKVEAAQPEPEKLFGS